MPNACTVVHKGIKSPNLHYEKTLFYRFFLLGMLDIGLAVAAIFKVIQHGLRTPREEIAHCSAENSIPIPNF